MRQLGRADVPRIEAALAGETDAVARERELVAWRARILAGDDREVQAFVEVYPRADRQAIRARAREGRREGPRATAAQVRLLRLLREGAAASDGGDGGPESGAP